MYAGLRYFSYGIALGLPVAVTFADYVGIVAVVTGNSMRVRQRSASEGEIPEWNQVFTWPIGRAAGAGLGWDHVHYPRPPTHCSCSYSLQPTLNPAGSSTRDMVWVSRWSLRHNQPRPGDIIALRWGTWGVPLPCAEIRHHYIMR